MSEYYGVLSNDGRTNSRQIRGFRTTGIRASILTGSVNAGMDVRKTVDGLDDLFTFIIHGMDICQLTGEQAKAIAAGKAKLEVRLRE